MAAERFHQVGADYCVQHHGIRNEDDELCDFKAREWRGDAPFPCRFRTLGYLKASR